MSYLEQLDEKSRSTEADVLVSVTVSMAKCHTYSRMIDSRKSRAEYMIKRTTKAA